MIKQQQPPPPLLLFQYESLREFVDEGGVASYTQQASCWISYGREGQWRPADSHFFYKQIIIIGYFLVFFIKNGVPSKNAAFGRNNGNEEH